MFVENKKYLGVEGASTSKSFCGAIPEKRRLSKKYT
jgi:hypothetical protein